MKKRHKILSKKTQYPEKPRKVISSYEDLDPSYLEPIPKPVKVIKKKQRVLNMEKPSDVDMYWRRRARTKAYNRKVNGITLYVEDIIKEYPEGIDADGIYHRYHEEHGITVSSANTYAMHVVRILEQKAKE